MTQSKYQPGDIVKIKPLEEVMQIEHKVSWVDFMDDYAGTEQIIARVSESGFYRFEGYVSQWTFTDSMIEGLVEEKKTIRDTDEKSNKFFVELTSLINRYSIDSNGNTPDYILAEYMIDCLKTFCSSLKNRMAHIYGESTPIPKEDKKDVPPGSYQQRLKDAAKNWASGFHGTLPLDQAEILAFNAGAKWENEQSVSAANATKLPQPQEQPTPVDKERLEKFVLAAMAGINGIQDDPAITAEMLVKYAAAVISRIDNN